MATFTSKIILRGQDKTKGAFGSVSRGIGGVGKAVAGLTSLLAAGGFILAGKQALDAADRVGKLSKQLGVSTEFLSQMGHAASLSGSDLDSFAKGMSQLERNVVNANEGLSTQVRAFERVGIKAEELKGLNPEEIFSRVADAVASIEDPSIKTATAMDIFGRAGKDLIPLLDEGSAGMARMREQADALGLTLGEDQTSAAEAANDAIEKFGAAVKGASNTLILVFAPTLQTIAEWLTIKLPLAIKGAQAAFIIFRKTVVDIVGTVSFALEDFFKVYGFLGEGFREAGRKVADVTQAMAEKSRELERELDAVIVATAALNLKLQNIVPDATDVADGLQEISVTATHLTADTDELTRALEALTVAEEFQRDIQLEVSAMATARVEAMKALKKALAEAIEVTDEKTAADKRAEEQALATAAAYRQLFSAVGSLNQTFGLGLSAQQGAGVATALQGLGVGGGFLETFAAGAAGASGGLGSQIGAGIGAAIGSFGGPIGTAIGSFLGEFVGGLFDSSNAPRDSQIIFGTGAINARGNQDPQDTRLGGTFIDALIRDSNSAFADQFLGPAVQAAEGFFNLVEQVLSPEQLAAASGALEGRTFTIRPEDVEGGRFLEPILDAIVNAMGPTVRRFVGQFEGIEAQLEAFAAINLTMRALEADPIQMWADALADADRTAIQVLRDMGDEIANLGESAFNSVEDMLAFGSSVETFNRSFIQFMAGLEQASRNIAASTESTIQGLRFSALEGNPNAQFEFLVRRANQLGAGISGLGSAEEVERTVAMIQQLLTQAFGIATPEQRQSLLPAFEATIQSAADEAQVRLDELRAEAEAIATERRDQIDALLGGMSEGNDAIIDAAGTIVDAGNVIVIGGTRIESGADKILQAANTIASTPNSVSYEVTG